MRVVYHVVYASGDDQWMVERERLRRPVVRTGTKEEAVAAARALGRVERLSQVVIHREDGSIERQFTCGADPRHIPG